MKMIKVAETTKLQLDWLVAKCEGLEVLILIDPIEVSLTTVQDNLKNGGWVYKPSTDWAHGGPIIERERLNIVPTSVGWEAYPDHGMSDELFEEGPTPLIAAMRCFVASKLGNEVEVPDELA